MNISNLNLINIRKITDEDVIRFHDKIHKLYSIVKQYRITDIEFGTILKNKHRLIINEIIKRDIDIDKTPLH